MKQEENLYHITNLQNPSQKKQGKHQLSKYYLLEQLFIRKKLVLHQIYSRYYALFTGDCDMASQIIQTSRSAHL